MFCNGGARKVINNRRMLRNLKEDDVKISKNYLIYFKLLTNII